MVPLNGKASRPKVKEAVSGGSERRRSRRHRLHHACGTLGWRQECKPLLCAFTAADISGGGAAVLAEQAPPFDQPVWIWLEFGDAGAGPLEARVLAVSSEASGKYLVRMQFTSWIRLGSVLEQHEEHRHWERYPARETRASLAWSDNGIQYSVTAELVNISGGGAAIVTDAVLPDKRPIWLTLQAECAAITPVECRLVVVSIDASGWRIARLRFVESCPTDLFDMAVNGAPAWFFCATRKVLQAALGSSN